jgi:hypothetical protein
MHGISERIIRYPIAAAGKPILLWSLLTSVVFALISFIGIPANSQGFFLPLSSAIATGISLMMAGTVIKIAHP